MLGNNSNKTVTTTHADPSLTKQELYIIKQIYLRNDKPAINHLNSKFIPKYEFYRNNRKKEGEPNSQKDLRSDNFNRTASTQIKKIESLTQKSTTFFTLSKKSAMGKLELPPKLRKVEKGATAKKRAQHSSTKKANQNEKEEDEDEYSKGLLFFIRSSMAASKAFLPLIITTSGATDPSPV